jgi:AAA+ ATPase superfamily predicted ATPase
MLDKDYFPLKLAKDQRFCNRVTEQEILKRNISLARHTVMVAPRRYGKSSLVHKVIFDLTLPHANIDLFLAHNDAAVTRRILDGIGSVLSQIMPLTQKAVSTLQKYFPNIRIGLIAGGFSLEATHETQSIGAVEQIYDTLKVLNTIAIKENKKVIIFIDEFQDVQNAESARSIQGALRSIAQDTDHLMFIFSGSSRSLLLQLFDDKAKPLYMLCDKINLGRMSSRDYEPYIQEAALKKWKDALSPDSFRRILLLTELHPFYVNLLCNEVFTYKKLPHERQVDEAWRRCCENEVRRLIAELENLTLNQQKALKALAVEATIEPYSHKFANAAGVSVSSLQACFDFFLEKDLVYRVLVEDELLDSIKIGQYRVLDPLLAYSLRQYTHKGLA